MTAAAPTARWGDRVFALLGLRLAAWVIAARAFLPGVLDEAWYRVALHHDEHYFWIHEEAARRSLVDFHQLFAWNPYFCGGIPGLANPQDTSMGPDFLMRLAFGVGAGRRLTGLLLMVLGMEGMYRLARRQDSSPTAAGFAAVVFATCGWFTQIPSLGWLNMYGFELFPWVALGFEAGLDRRAWRLVGGGFLAWMVLCGGTYSVPYAVVMLGLLSLVAAARDAAEPTRARPWYAPFRCVAEIGLVSVGLSAIKLLPMMRIVTGSPRLWHRLEVAPAIDVFARIIGPPPFAPDAAHVAPAVALLALAGVAWDRKAATSAFLALCFFLLSMGDFAPLAPNTLLRTLPVFNQLRSPYRMAFVASFFLCLGAARAVTLLEDAPLAAALWARNRFAIKPARALGAVARVAVGALAAFVVYTEVTRPTVDAQRVDTKVGSGVYVMDPPLTRRETFRQARGNRWDAQVWAAADRGSLQCFEETPFPQSPRLRGDLQAEEYPADPGAATVRRLAWSPNEIALRVSARRATTVLINQNFHRGWRSNVGRVRNDLGLLAVEVPAGDHRLVVTFRDPWLRAGTLLSFATALGLAVALARWLRERGRALRAEWASMPWWPSGPQRTMASASPPPIDS